MNFKAALAAVFLFAFGIAFGWSSVLYAQMIFGLSWQAITAFFLIPALLEVVLVQGLCTIVRIVEGSPKKPPREPMPKLSRYALLVGVLIGAGLYLVETFTQQPG